MVTKGNNDGTIRNVRCDFLFISISERIYTREKCGEMVSLLNAAACIVLHATEHHQPCSVDPADVGLQHTI